MVRAESNMIKNIALALAGFLACLVAMHFAPNRYEEAAAVMSTCGIYAVITVDSKGDMEVFGADNPVPIETFETLTKLEEDKRHTVLVPCPPVELPDDHFQAQNRG